jgi:hypothetical protein
MPTPRPLSRALVPAALALAACQDAPPLTAPAPAAAAPAVALSLSLLDALDDAGARVVPVLDHDVRGALGAALGELRAALAAGDGARGARGVARVRALVEAHRGGSADADGADLAAVGLLADAAARELAGVGARGEGGR